MLVKRRLETSSRATTTSQKIATLNTDISNRAIAAIDPTNIKIKPEILANIEKMKIQVEELEIELSVLSQKMDADKERFLKFAFGFVANMGENFLSISQENRIKCKQIVFPAGFRMDSNKIVYTPEISPLIRLVSKKKDLSEPEKSLLVRLVDYRWNQIYASMMLMYEKLVKFGLDPKLRDRDI